MAKALFFVCYKYYNYTINRDIDGVIMIFIFFYKYRPATGARPHCFGTKYCFLLDSITLVCGRYRICLPTLATFRYRSGCFVSGRQILTCRLYIYSGSVPSGRMYGIYFFLYSMRSGGGRLLVCFLWSPPPGRNLL